MFRHNCNPLARLWITESTTQMIAAEHSIKGVWNRQVIAARIAWNRLTEDELLASDGEHEKLVALVQERYEISRDEAARRVRNFMEAR